MEIDFVGGSKQSKGIKKNKNAKAITTEMKKAMKRAEKSQ